MSAVAIVQARMGSTRLPGKVLTQIGDRSLLEWVLTRCRLSLGIRGVLVATTTSSSDDGIVELCERFGVGAFRGSEDDVLARFVGAAESVQADSVVRITADNPLIDPRIMEQALASQEAVRSDYTCAEGYPLGIGEVEVVTLSALRRALAETTPGEAYYREHVTTYVVTHADRFYLNALMAPNSARRPDLRLTVDEPSDLELIRHVVAYFQPRVDFGVREVIAFLDSRPDLAAINRHVRQRT